MFPWNLFPFDKDIKNKMENMKPEEINQYIQGIMGKVMPSQFGSTMFPQDLTNNSQQPDSLNKKPAAVFETHDSVFVRIPISNEACIEKLKICHTANQLTVENLPENQEKKTFLLPAIVKRKGATAKYKDGILEVRLFKSYEVQYSEIAINKK